MLKNEKNYLVGLGTLAACTAGIFAVEKTMNNDRRKIDPEAEAEYDLTETYLQFGLGYLLVGIAYVIVKAIKKMQGQQ